MPFREREDDAGYAVQKKTRAETNTPRRKPASRNICTRKRAISPVRCDTGYYILLYATKENQGSLLQPRRTYGNVGALLRGKSFNTGSQPVRPQEILEKRERRLCHLCHCWYGAQYIA